MANVDAAFGFRPIRRLDGAAWTGNHTTRKITGATAALNRGDVVAHAATGYVTPLAAGVLTGVGLGIFVGCHYLASSLGYPIWSNYWPGAGAVGDVDVFIIDDPSVVFEVQAGTPAIAFADIGMNGDVVVTASTTGFSKWKLSAGAVTATLPFRIVGLGNGGVNNGENGYDTTSAFNIVEVAWNAQFHKTALGV
jgi:hypothetical protein